MVSAIGYETVELTYIALERTSDEINFSLKESTTVVDEVVAPWPPERAKEICALFMID